MTTHKSPRATGKRKPQSSAVHRRILAESAAVQAAGRPWSRASYPALAALLDAAILEARSRTRLRGQMAFMHAGHEYIARFTNFDRVIVEDPATGCKLASSGFGAL